MAFITNFIMDNKKDSEPNDKNNMKKRKNKNMKKRMNSNNFLIITKESFGKTKTSITVVDEDDYNNYSTNSNSNNSFLLKPVVALKPCLKKDYTKFRKIHQLPVKSSYQVTLPVSKKTQTKSRYISFNEQVDVWMIPSISDLLINYNYIDGELILRSIWFQQDEYDTIQFNLRYLTRAINYGKVGKNVYCTRGLERKLNNIEEGDEETTTTRSLVSNLLKEQKKQYRNGIYDEQRLYQVCREISRKDIIEATKLGILDEAISRRILQQ
ncbi:MAG: hypothetical protein ACI8RD_010128 [Bacillariaceae sp.]|jgi:hypothetical protein